MSIPGDFSSKYLRFYAVTSDVYGIDPLLDKVVPELMKISVYSTHEVTQDERGAPDLISLREYGTDELWWIVMQYNGIGSYKRIVEGITLKIPQHASVISAITHNTIRETNVQRVITI